MQIKKIFAVQQAIKEQEAERIKSFDAIIADLNLELALKTATTEQAREQLRLEAEIAKLKVKDLRLRKLAPLPLRRLS
jgi:hypothetical protein